MFYFLLIIISLLLGVPLYIAFKQYNFLVVGDISKVEVEDDYVSYVNFISNARMLVRYYLRRFYKICNFFLHYAEFLFIKFLSFFQALFDGFYKRMISRFLESSISNKSYVKFFWKDLKKFKREIDSENEM